MKKLIYLFSITITLTVFSSVSANAQTLAPSATKTPGVMCDFLSDLLAALFGNNNTSTTTTNSGSNCGSTSSTQLPINGGVEFLMIAGVVIGIVTVQRYKAVKPAPVTLQNKDRIPVNRSK